MESLISVLILAGVVYLLLPFIAMAKASGARRRVDALESETSRLKEELRDLQSQVATLRNAAAARAAPAEAPATASYAPASKPAPAAVVPPTFALPAAAPPAPARPETSQSTLPAYPSLPERADTPAAPRPAPAADGRADEFSPGYVQPPPAWAGAASALFGKAKNWLLSGNLVAKLGLIILFIGVSFLLKYVAGQISVPIELRLAGIALADIALLGWGWRIRQTRPGISLPVQGAALAILMLVVFGAFRLYHLIPGGLAFALLLVLTAFTCLLAVLQNAVWLATFGIVGGFAVPLLASTGGGSHIGLFSYYALLNAGVLAIALKRSWRMLNLLGFAFTFIVGTAWGVLKYAPEHYLSTQLFLILFFLFYVAIALAYAAHEAPKLRHYVDATLVFGTPLLAMGLQYGLVKALPFGLAFSALALGLFYTGLALVLWRRAATFKLLAETFLALGIVFGTLALPFALDGRWTSAAWALEGAGIVWVGLRQRQPLAWIFGLLVQAGAWLSFLGAVSGLDPAAALQQNLWLGFLILAASALFMATTLRKAPAESGGAALSWLALLFLGGATLWLLAGSWTEIFLRTDGATQLNLLTGSAVLIAIALGLIATRLQWRAAGNYALLVQAAAGVALLAKVGTGWIDASPALFDGPFLSALMLGAAVFLSAWFIERQARRDQAPQLARMAAMLLPGAGFCWFALVLTALASWFTAYAPPQLPADDYLHPERWFSAYVIALALSTPLFGWLARRLDWPALRWFTAPAWLALAASCAAMLAALYLEERIPGRLAWTALAAAWLAGEYLLQLWPRAGWRLGVKAQQALHSVRTGAPWLMLWPLGVHYLSAWLLAGASEPERMLAQAGWEVSGSWARYLPAWAMMLLAALLARRSRDGGWPLAPVAAWYRRCLIPLAALWSCLLVAVWNIAYNGAMAPLPYLPLLNPLDLSTGFAILLAVTAYRLLRAEHPALPQLWRGRLPVVAGCVVYAWLNLMLLRSVSNYMDVPYRFEAMLDSRFVQALLSLVWSVTALILMRHATLRQARKQWSLGAVLLGLVVLKLFTIDLSNVGGIERIVSFVGVGGLMLLIGYLAPFPGKLEAADTAAPETPRPI
ncbi:DUF2339 domain-containing protein [Janthinobacterium fluminis]|uniref:DUF2339 domain-containing protein n=1 Tax=Janthinobacterium fluminis TaxID=2987524 RepID=A0ABT5K249_9BURK|nr:DUF2339 domain-containing protein [Janthinobacterium fluminis]MDC8759062.1 DUF2339 domain-containing protein [Janthinobacterium fluminis]